MDWDIEGGFVKNDISYKGGEMIKDKELEELIQKRVSLAIRHQAIMKILEVHQSIVDAICGKWRKGEDIIPSFTPEQKERLK